MKKKRKVKERNVRQLRQLIGAVTEENGEEGTLPMSFFPLRVMITILSVAGVVFAVALLGRALLVESDFFQGLELVFSTGDSEALSQVGKVVFGLVLHFVIGNGSSWWFVEMKKWQRGKPLQEKPAVKLLKR